MNLEFSMQRYHLYLLVAVLAFIVCLFVYVKMERYTIVSSGEKTAYQLDRWTGEIWLLVLQKRIKIEDFEELKKKKR